MAIVKSLVKGISTTVGEVLVVGGALGLVWVHGFIKGSEAKQIVKDTVNKVGDVIAKTTKKTEEEPVAEATESTTGDDTPPIEVSVTNQPED